jgi:hypothetical protein
MVCSLSKYQSRARKAMIDVRNKHVIFSVRRTWVIVFSYSGKASNTIVCFLSAHSQDSLNETLVNLDRSRPIPLKSYLLLYVLYFLSCKKVKLSP